MASISSSILKIAKAVQTLGSIDPKTTTDIMVKTILPMFVAIGLLAAGLGQIRIWIIYWNTRYSGNCKINDTINK